MSYNNNNDTRPGTTDPTPNAVLKYNTRRDQFYVLHNRQPIMNVLSPAFAGHPMLPFKVAGQDQCEVCTEFFGTGGYAPLNPPCLHPICLDCASKWTRLPRPGNDPAERNPKSRPGIWSCPSCRDTWDPLYGDQRTVPVFWKFPLIRKADHQREEDMLTIDFVKEELACSKLTIQNLRVENQSKDEELELLRNQVHSLSKELSGTKRKLIQLEATANQARSVLKLCLNQQIFNDDDCVEVTPKVDYDCKETPPRTPMSARMKVVPKAPIMFIQQNRNNTNSDSEDDLDDEEEY